MKCNFHFWNKLEKHFVNIHAISPLVILIIMNSPHSCHFVVPINIFQPSQFDNPDQEAWLTVIEAIGVIYIDINLMINECISQGQCKVNHTSKSSLGHAFLFKSRWCILLMIGNQKEKDYL